MLDPGSGRQARETAVASLRLAMEAREDLEVFLELRGRSCHHTWRLLQQDATLERVTVLDTVGPLRDLIGTASIVVAPDPACPARSILPAAMCADTRNDELLQEGRTAVVPTEATPDSWCRVMIQLVEDPPLRQRIAVAAAASASEACRPETAIDAWITAFTASADPPAYPLG